MHDILKHVGKARIIVFYYSAHTYVVSLSTKVAEETNKLQKNKNTEHTKYIDSLNSISSLPHVWTFSLDPTLYPHRHLFTFYFTPITYQFFIFLLPRLFSCTILTSN